MAKKPIITISVVLIIMLFTLILGMQWVQSLLKGLPPENAGSEQIIVDIVELLDLKATFYTDASNRILDREDLISSGYPIRETAINIIRNKSNPLAFLEQNVSIYADENSASAQYEKFKIKLFSTTKFDSIKQWDEVEDQRLFALHSEKHFIACGIVLTDDTNASNKQCQALLQRANRIWYLNSWVMREDKEYLNKEQFIEVVIAADMQLKNK